MTDQRADHLHPAPAATAAVQQESTIAPTSPAIAPKIRRRQILDCIGPPGPALRMAQPAQDDSARGADTPPMEACIHEAGHAVAQWYVGVPFQEVRIGPEPGQPHGLAWPLMAGGVVPGFAGAPPRRDWLALAEAGDATALERGRMAAEMEMFCAYAGPFAQAQYPTSWVCRTDGAPRRRR